MIHVLYFFFTPYYYHLKILIIHKNKHNNIKTIAYLKKKCNYIITYNSYTFLHVQTTSQIKLNNIKTFVI